ncbi:MAG: O-antigen ligase family protein [Clostridiales bacterium]|nr:O-antigen ligase family protein [Clostridiales bacterium]
MKKIRLRRSISLNTVMLYIGFFCVVTYALVEHANTSIPMIYTIKIPLLLAGGVCLLAHVKTISRVLLRKNYFAVLLSALVVCLLLVWSMFLNRSASFGDSPLRRTFRMVLYLMELFLYMIVLAEKGRGKLVVNFLFWYLLLLVVLNDALMFSGVIRFRDGRYENYLVGTKFNVAYLHMNLLTMWFVRSKMRPRRVRFAWVKILLMALLIMVICLRVDVMSGVLGSMALIALFILSGNPKGRKLAKMASPTVLVMTFALSIIFVFIAHWVISIPAVRFVVEDVFKRDTTITGRLNIYEDFVVNMQGHWLTGYGLGNGTAVAQRLFGYNNVQNGVLDWVLQVGIFAAGSMLAMIVVVFRQLSRRRGQALAPILPLVSLLYMYIILGMIETTMDMSFFLWVAMIFLLVNERHPEERLKDSPASLTGLTGAVHED